MNKKRGQSSKFRSRLGDWFTTQLRAKLLIAVKIIRLKITETIVMSQFNLFPIKTFTIRDNVTKP